MSVIHFGYIFSANDELDRTEPWGILQFTLYMAECSEPTKNVWMWSNRYDLNHSREAPLLQSAVWVCSEDNYGQWCQTQCWNQVAWAYSTFELKALNSYRLLCWLVGQSSTVPLLSAAQKNQRSMTTNSCILLKYNDLIGRLVHDGIRRGTPTFAKDT